MMQLYRLSALMIWIGLSACAENGASGGSTDIDDPIGTGAPLVSVAFTGNVLRTETRLISYSSKAGRLSIVDPVAEKEIWGKYIPGYEFGVAHPDLQGATLFKANTAMVLVGNEERVFALQTDYAHAARADNSVAYSLASRDGRSFELIRSLGNGQWQHETFSVPWVDTLDPAVTEAPPDQPVLLVSRFNAGGTMLTVFSPSDGRYAVYTAPGSDRPITAVTSWCAGDGKGSVDAASFTSLAWDEVRQRYYLGNKYGTIYALDPTAPCSGFDKLPQLELAEPATSNRISVLLSGLISISQDNGTLTMLSFDGALFSTNNTPYQNVCDRPLSAMELAGSYLLVLCVKDESVVPGSAESPDPSDINLEPRTYVTFDTGTGTIVQRIPKPVGTTAGIAVDTDNYLLYRMKEGAFGRLETSNLISGEVRTNDGIFLQNILD